MLFIAAGLLLLLAEITVVPLILAAVPQPYQMWLNVIFSFSKATQPVYLLYIICACVHVLSHACAYTYVQACVAWICSAASVSRKFGKSGGAILLKRKYFFGKKLKS